jgi:hypothetical protein
MKFTFEKYKNKLLKIILIISAIFLFLLIFFYIIDCLILSIFLLIFIVFILKKLHDYQKVKKFLKLHDRNEIADFENEISNYLLRYANCYFTDKYIFCLQSLIYIKYDEINCVDPSIVLKFDSSKSAQLVQKQIIYLNNGKKYVLYEQLAKNPKKIITLIKKKNPNVYIGNINDFKKNQVNIEKINEIKKKTRV